MPTTTDGPRFEIHGGEGSRWETRCTGQLRDRPAVIPHDGRQDRQTTTLFTAPDASSGTASAGRPLLCRRLVDGIGRDERRRGHHGPPAACVAVYQAGNPRRPVDPRPVTGAVSPEGRPG